MCLNKRLIVVIAIFVATLFVGEVLGQKYLDTVRMKMPNKVTVEYLMNYGQKKLIKEKYLTKKGKENTRYVKQEQFLASSFEWRKGLGDFLLRWQTLGIDNIEDREPLCITDKDMHITIVENKKPVKVYFPKDKQLALTIEGRHKLCLQQEYYTINIYFDKIKQLQELNEYDFMKISQKADRTLQKNESLKFKKRGALIAWTQYGEENNVKVQDIHFLKRKKQNYLEIFPSSGLGFAKGDWNAVLSLEMGIVLSNNIQYSDKFSIAYEWMYNFSEGNKNINQWIDVGYQKNTSLLSQKSNWIGLSLGYLIHKNGDLFDDHTFRLGLPTTIHTNIKVTPQLYFKDFFKDAYPGVKISFNL